jgi:succinate dehydrogenase / fumarate reductase cytochrome b subunit
MAHADATGPRKTRERPLSPHLQIYKPLINMTMSILHRITGAANYFGTIILAWWLFAAATGKGYFDLVNGLLGTPIGLLLLVGYTWSVMHHMMGGIRHFIWDTGRGFSLASVNALSWATILLSLSITAAIWAVALSLRGMI